MVAAVQRGGLAPFREVKVGPPSNLSNPHSPLVGKSSFRQITQLFTVGQNPLDAIRGKSSLSIPELLTVQRSFSEYAVKVELCAKTAEAASGVLRRLQQGG